MDFIESHPNRPWNWYPAISRNPNLTIDFVTKHLDKSWDWSKIPYNMFIYNDVVCKHSMLQDIKTKRNFIVGDSCMVLDLAKIVADYCGYL